MGSEESQVMKEIEEKDQKSAGDETRGTAGAPLKTISEMKSVKGKLLGVDLGDKRTGVAVSDKGQNIASGISTISVGGMEKTAAEIAKIAKERGAAGIIVGQPVNMDGSFGARATHCAKFARILSGVSELPVCLFDERMTTMVAARYLNETDTRGQKRKGVIDTLSAQIILQNALDRLKNLN